MKKCPYCGSNQLHDEIVSLPTWDSKPRCTVVCTICGASGPRAKSLEIAKQRWNGRAREGSKQEFSTDRDQYPCWL